MKASVLQPGGILQLQERKIPPLHEDEVLLQVKACGLCGTDILKIQKKVTPPDSQGIVLGHEVSGVVTRVGSQVTTFKVGDRVVVAHHVPCGDCHFCRHGNDSMCEQFRRSNLDPGGFSEFLKIPALHLQKTAFQIPDSLSFEEASFMEPVACCLRAFYRSRLLPGDSVFIVGLGSIGLILVQIFKGFGMDVFVSDLVEDRKKLAQHWGAKIPVSTGEKHEGRGWDMVLFTAGSPDLFQKSLRWVRDGGKVHLFSSLSGAESNFPMNELYHRELEVMATYSSSPAMLQEALRWLVEKRIDVKSLITSRFSLEDVSSAVDQTLSREILKAIIVP